jgi:hypothetical protein
MTAITMQELLEENSPDRILLGLAIPQIGDDFIKNADEKAFARALCALDSEHFIVPYRNLFRYLKPSLETQPKYRIVRSFEERVGSFLNILDNLVTRRQEHGHPLGLDVYRHLLRCAAAAGVGSFARNVFHTLMPEEGVAPDLDCYNYYMEALTWNEAHNRHERYRLRIVSYNMIRRSRAERPVGFHGHGVALPNNPQNLESIRLETLGIFNELVSQGLSGNEATFCNVMVAMGREGDLGSVKSVLKSVWNIDVEALDKYDEEELESPTFYEEGSPLRPSARLLYTVVHIFGTNNDVAQGGMLLDYISRNYNLDIPEYVWTHLLEWTFVLSIQHRKDRLEMGYGAGRIARRAVDSVYHVFHSEPYNVKPKIVDLIYRANARAGIKLLPLVIDDLRQCMELLEEERTNVSELYDELRWWIRHREYYADGLPSAEFLELKRKYIMASLHLDCHIQLILVAVRRTFRSTGWPSPNDGTEWMYRTLPNMVAEWGAWLPNVIPYFVHTGHVQIIGKTSRHEAIKSANSVQTIKTGSVRTLLDTYSPQRLRHAVEFLHRAGDTHLLAKFQAEVENDSSEQLRDWVLRYEMTARRERLSDRQVADKSVNVPGPDSLDGSWNPFFRNRDYSSRRMDEPWDPEDEDLYVHVDGEAEAESDPKPEKT